MFEEGESDGTVATLVTGSTASSLPSAAAVAAIEVEDEEGGKRLIGRLREEQKVCGALQLKPRGCTIRHPSFSTDWHHQSCPLTTFLPPPLCWRTAFMEHLTLMLLRSLSL